jgi:hypothetical protein
VVDVVAVVGDNVVVDVVVVTVVNMLTVNGNTLGGFVVGIGAIVGITVVFVLVGIGGKLVEVDVDGPTVVDVVVEVLVDVDVVELDVEVLVELVEVSVVVNSSAILILRICRYTS